METAQETDTELGVHDCSEGGKSEGRREGGGGIHTRGITSYEAEEAVASLLLNKNLSIILS